jgi:hypothetical protein
MIGSAIVLKMDIVVVGIQVNKRGDSRYEVYVRQA